MKRLFSAKTIAAAAVAFGAVAATSAAHARSDVVFSIGFNTPAYVHPAPVYVAPQPVYVQPAPVYYHGHGRYYGHDRRHGPYGDWDGDGVANRYDPRPHHYDARIGHRGHRDWDRDGVPNRYDARPHNPYRY